MAEVLLLKQQIEFLQLELEEAKSREKQLKSMYDSMLKSFSFDTPRLTTSSSVELKSAEEKFVQDRMKIKIKYKEKIRTLIKENEQLQDEKNDLELKINEIVQNQEMVKGLYQKEILMMKGQRAEAERKANESYETMQKIIARKNEIITNLKNEIEEVKKENNEEINRITEDTNRSLHELKSIYEKEKPAPVENEVLENLKSEFKSLQEVIKALESTEACLKEQLKFKDDHIDKLTRKLRIKASEDTKNVEFKDFTELKETLSEKLIDKDIEISKLKKIIGELRLELANNANKPPIYSPKAFRSMTFIQKFESSSTESFFLDKNEDLSSLKNYEKMVLQAYSLQCEKCLEKFSKDTFLEHIENCEDEENKAKVLEEDEKAKRLEKHVERLKLSLANMKTQRDKAKIECEKLLMQLKQAKVEWAVSEEDLEERLMEIRGEFRNMVDMVIRVWRGTYLPDHFRTEIERVVRKSDKFFGGRLTKSFVN